MKMKTAMPAALLAMATVLSACGDDNEARLSQLEGELAASREQVVMLEQQLTEAQASGTDAATSGDAIRDPLLSAAEAMRAVDDRLTEMESAADASANPAVSELRSDLQRIGQSLTEIADATGVDLSQATGNP